jgi:eukaryotic-like serine/threonine-protein kinase
MTPDSGESAAARRPDPIRAFFDRLQVLGAIANCRSGGWPRWGAQRDCPGRSTPKAGLRPGGAWGRFTVIGPLGGGSFADVYEALDPGGARVALKVPSGRQSRVAIRDILRESDALGRVRHHNVVAGLGAETSEGRHALVMELVRGVPLDKLLAYRQPYSVQDAARIGMSVCRAVSAVHSAGLVHRDIKAQNVIVEPGGRVVLVDFGLTRLAGRARPTPRRFSGTPLYMAPEVLEGGRPTRASDLYSIGVLLYHLVSKQFPVCADSLDALVEAHRAQRIRPLSAVRPALPVAFIDTVSRALARNPAHRHANAGLLFAALHRVASSAHRW